jgi:phosphohistidine phosphatase SixA
MRSRRCLIALVAIIVSLITVPLGYTSFPAPTVPPAHAVPPDHADSRAANLWKELREGSGYVVLLRHALAPGTGDPAGFRLDNCSTQRNLSAEGRRQAVAIGAEWRRQRLPIDRVLTSRWCRARDTARLLAVGKVTAYPALDSSFTVSDSVAAGRTRIVRNLIRKHQAKPGVLVLVTHQVNITSLTGVVPSSGGAVVVRARSDGSLRVVGMLP